jgi:hypothetical protein
LSAKIIAKKCDDTENTLLLSRWFCIMLWLIRILVRNAHSIVLEWNLLVVYKKYAVLWSFLLCVSEVGSSTETIIVALVQPIFCRCMIRIRKALVVTINTQFS